jgi:hypothetical protein
VSVTSFDGEGGAGGDAKGGPSLKDLVTPGGEDSSSDSEEEEQVLQVAPAKKSKKPAAKAKPPILQARVTGARMTTKGDHPNGSPNPLREYSPPTKAKKRRVITSSSQGSQATQSSKSSASSKKRSRQRTAASPVQGRLYIMISSRLFFYFDNINP